MEKRDRVFQQRDNPSILNCPSTGMGKDSISEKVEAMVMCSESMFKSVNGVDPFYGSGWDPIGSLNQSGNLGNSSMVPLNEFTNPHYSSLLENQTMGSSSHMVHFPSGSGIVDTVSKIPNFDNEHFSEMVSSFGYIADQIGVQRDRTNVTQPQQNSEDEVLGASSIGKRKRRVALRNSTKNAEEEKKQDNYGDISEFPEEDDGKKQSIGANSSSKQTVNQAIENTDSAEPSKDNYIHVRAKRGQATNSHSLAERVRRERISERMRLLQELVPGCNKITGKAVMLDEIINYVQSLQQQVEFLSMKLATVNPELNLDIERILSKDIIHSRGSSAAEHGNGLVVSSAHLVPGYSQGTFNGAPCTTAPFHTLPQNLWNNIDLQNVLQMGFGSSPDVRSFGQNGPSQMEL